MDWLGTDDVELRVMPRGEQHTSDVSGAATWESKYGSVVTYSYNYIANSGVNEKKLAVDALYLYGSKYPDAQGQDNKISTAMMVQYLLDNFETTADVVKYFENNPLPVVVEGVTGQISGYPLNLHYIVTDKSGDNAIIEYIDGTVKVHHIKGRVVLTNDPSFDKISAVRDYFVEAGIDGSMPGSSLSQARFVYLTGWLDQFTNNELQGYLPGIKNKSFANQMAYSVLSLMRGVSTPLGVEISMEKPNNTSTVWRTVSDVTNGRFYFDSVLTPTTMWIDIDDVDFAKPGSVDVSGNTTLHGDVTELLK